MCDISDSQAVVRMQAGCWTLEARVKLGTEWSSDACACGVIYIRIARASVPGLRSLWYGTSTASERMGGPRGEGYASGRERLDTRDLPSSPTLPMSSSF